MMRYQCDSCGLWQGDEAEEIECSHPCPSCVIREFYVPFVDEEC